jgi:N-acyl-D-aspartate/D-glutamate deacylase
MIPRLAKLLILIALLLAGCAEPVEYDTILRSGTIYDGSGEPSYQGDVAIQGDTVAAVGDIGRAVGKTEIDVTGMAVAPGFVNMMCWSNLSLIEDGRSQSDIRQGVTLEVMGEGESMGPLNAQMKKDMQRYQGDIKFDVTWDTLGGYLQHLEDRGVSPNVASFLGAATPRVYVMGHEDRDPTADEMEQMKAVVRQAMEEGALGISSSLIYPPGAFSKTEELIELAKVTAEYDGLYISHLRSEGGRLIEAIDELLTIAREADIRAEIYHLKAMGTGNWNKLDEAIAMIEKARAEGLEITADVYTYEAGSTGLKSCMPPWVEEGGFQELLKRLRDPATRKRIAKEMTTPGDWENFFLESGSPDNILLVGFVTDKLKPLAGKTLAEVAKMRGTSPEETVMDLISEDGSRISTVYFMMSEDNLRKKIALPWVSFCSDSASIASEGVFIENSTHPRAYGSFARVLGKFARDEQLLSLEAAVRKLAALPSEVLRLDRRGRLAEGYFADVVVFDPAEIQDHATYENPHQYATGMQHVFVNGEAVLKDGEHTGASPGRFIKRAAKSD